MTLGARSKGLELGLELALNFAVPNKSVDPNLLAAN